MTDIETSIGQFDADARNVPVIFTSGTVVHRRDVNACFDSEGRYDIAATAARVADVARGVAIKISLGVIVNPPPAPEPQPEI